MTGAMKSKIYQMILICSAVLMMPFVVVIGKTIYIDNNADGVNDGSSWANAYLCLQDALAITQSGDEIKVAQGTYKPDQEVVKGRSVRTVASGDRTATFQLKNGVSMRGGYAGAGESDPDARDIHLYKTILSGDLNSDDGPNFTNYSENSYHVVTGDGTDATAVLDGFIVTGGNATDTDGGYGGGMFNILCTPTVTNCIFIRNLAARGGGMANMGDVGILSGPAITNCSFSGNLAQWGGGMCFWGFGRGTLTNCTFSGNTAEDGAAIIITKSSEVTIWSCTFTENRASDGTAGGISCTGDCTVTLLNSILWGDNPNEIELLDSSITVAYSDVQGGWPGAGNIDTDPLFEDIDGADDAIDTEDDDLHLRPGSPCINAGDNSAIPQSVTTDLDGNPRIINRTVDMGAYEANMAATINILYVDAINGNDNNNGLTSQTAFATIQKGIDTAVDGDIVLVYPGLYQEEINFMGKKLTVQGVAISPVGVPVLHNHGDFVVSFYSGEGPDSILKNFIIKDSFMGVFIADSSPTLINLTIVGNKYGIEAYADSVPVISNSILWDNTDSDLFGCRARYSCVERGDEGEGNIMDDPLFVDPDNEDYHIRSERGRYWPQFDIWVLDRVTSLCVDGGDPNIDPLDEPVPNGGQINIGAYGGTLEASMSQLRLSTKYSGGSGTVEDPYQISTADDLMLLGDGHEDYDKHFILTADIDLDPSLSGRKVFDKAVIAPNRNPDMYSPFDGIPFTGAFDGNDHTISNLTITGESYLGLFGQLGPEARISDIGLEAVYIDGIGISIGGLVGYNNGSITKSYSTGTVRGAYGVGGLASYSDGCITACYSTGIVSGSTDVGGLVGFNAGTITSSHCNETVTGDENVGGLVGYHYSVKLGGGVITTSYSTGSVFGRRACIGGLVGRNQGNITTSYSTSAVSGTSILGGLVGWNARGGSVTSSFWDMETSGKSISDGGIGKTTTEMQMSSTFLEVGWDFIDETQNGTEDIWWILENQDYPRLYWEPIEDVQTRTNIYYVDAVKGNNNNNGLTSQTAFATIQKGINTAVDGEVVLVYPGLYQEGINFMGKALTVQGIIVSPTGAPVLKNPGDYAISFYSGEGPNSIMKNFLIRDSFMGVFIAGSSPTISNLTIVNNKYGIEAYVGSEPNISNCILWNNSHDDLFQCRARYSCIERGSEGEGNISADPLFVDADNGDYHIRSERGRYWPRFDIWVLDRVTGPSVDAGDPQAKVSNEPMPNGGRINIGAYGGTVEASFSPGEQPGPLSKKASNPYPPDGAINVEGYITLTWTVGLNAASHDVYFGSDRDDVAGADASDTTGVYLGCQTAAAYTLPEDVRGGAINLYWRIDEVDSNGNITTGDIWTFRTTSGSPPKGRVCFTAETGVWVNDIRVPISKVIAGQSICGLNNPYKIQEIQEHSGTFTCYDVLLESGNCISVAENHYFLTETGQWLSLKELKEGIRLRTLKGTVVITNITKRPKPYIGTVYNLKIDGSDQYHVGKDAIVVRDY